MSKKITIVYKRKPNEKNVSPYNTVLLSLMKSNMNIQFVTGVYGLLAYLTSYLCKPEHKASELMKKAGKEASGLGLKEKLREEINIQEILNMIRKTWNITQFGWVDIFAFYFSLLAARIWQQSTIRNT